MCTALASKTARECGCWGGVFLSENGRGFSLRSLVGTAYYIVSIASREDTARLPSSVQPAGRDVAQFFSRIRGIPETCLGVSIEGDKCESNPK